MSISRLGAAVALSLLFASPLAAQGTKVGYINTAQVWSEYAPAQEADRQLNATMAGFQLEIDRLEADLAQAYSEFEQQQSTMTPEARQRRDGELRAQQLALSERAQELQDQIAQRRAEVYTPINEAIRSVLEEIRVEGNYGLILDAAVQAILVADPALDLTQQVLTRLQARSGSEDGT
jgi:outer membrane protein